MTYPANWYPSGITYANAFELRNYPPKDAGAVSESNQASVTTVTTLTDNAEAAKSFVESQFSPNATSLTIDGHRAIRVQRDLPAQSLGPGTKGAQKGTPNTGSSRSYRHISTYIANGRYVVAMEGVAPSDADPSVFADILRIENGIRFSRN